MRRPLTIALALAGIAAFPAIADDAASKAQRLHARAIVGRYARGAPYRLEKTWADVGSAERRPFRHPARREAA